MKSYKYKIRKPSKAVIARFEQTLDICREVYNAALQERRDAWNICRKRISYYDQSKSLTEIRQIREDVKALPVAIGRDPLQRIDKAFKAFFRRVKAHEKCGYPRFKSKARYGSFTGYEGFKLQGNKLTLFKIGSVRLHLSRPVEGKIKTCTIKREATGWFVIFDVEVNQSRWIPKTGDTCGVDVGIENFATLSTGKVIENPRYLRKAERALKIQQRKVSKKILRGANRRKARVILAKKYLKVADQRRDFFHKTSLQLIREFDHVVFEDLNIAGMVKNHYLAKSISDAAWGAFLNIHFAKAANAGRTAEKVNPYCTSQNCSQCGARMKLSLSMRTFRCTECGFVAPRDENAAINIKSRGRTGPLVSVGVS